MGDRDGQEVRFLLDLERKYCQKNAHTIYRLAKHIYNTVVGHKDPLMVKNCCDFKKLEAACAEYTKAIPGIAQNEKNEDTQPDKQTLKEKLVKGKLKAQEQDSRADKPSITSINRRNEPR